MPEALAVFFVGVVSIVVYIGAKLSVGGAAGAHGHTTEQLLRHRAWLIERLEKAQREDWDSSMRRQLELELVATNASLRQTGR